MTPQGGGSLSARRIWKRYDLQSTDHKPKAFTVTRPIIWKIPVDAFLQRSWWSSCVSWLPLRVKQTIALPNQTLYLLLYVHNYKEENGCNELPSSLRSFEQCVLLQRQGCTEGKLVWAGLSTDPLDEVWEATWMTSRPCENIAPVSCERWQAIGAAHLSCIWHLIVGVCLQLWIKGSFNVC